MEKICGCKKEGVLHTVKRVPITIKRTAVIFTRGTRHMAVIRVSRYYEFLARKADNLSTYYALSSHSPQNHPNWRHFQKVWELCIVNGWDYRLYLESQFERATYWTHSTKPQPNQLYSENAQKYYVEYIKDMEEKFDNGSRLYKHKHKKSKKLEDEMIDCIIDDCQKLQKFLSKFKSIEQQLEEKSLFILENWSDLSPYYLSTIPWFKNWFEDIVKKEEGNELVSKYAGVLNMIEKRKHLKELASCIATEAEKHHNLTS